MAIGFRGGVEGSAINGGNITLDLTALTGGSGTAALAGDVVHVLASNSGGGTIAISTAGYTLLLDQVASDYGRKVMGSTPDTSVNITGSGNANHSVVAIALVFSGVDNTKPEDATTTTATGSSTNPDPPSITTTTTDAWVVAAMVTAVLDTSVTAPTGYGNQFDIAGDDTSDTTIGMATKTVATPGAEDPAAWTNVSTAGWRGITVALRQAHAVGEGLSRSVLLERRRLAA